MPINSLLKAVKAIFSSKDVLKKGILGDLMCESTPYRQKAFNERDLLKWESFANETYISEAGWYFKTLAVQEMGKEIDSQMRYRDQRGLNFRPIERKTLGK